MNISLRRLGRLQQCKGYHTDRKQASRKHHRTPSKDSSLCKIFQNSPWKISEIRYVQQSDRHKIKPFLDRHNNAVHRQAPKALFQNNVYEQRHKQNIHPQEYFQQPKLYRAAPPFGNFNQYSKPLVSEYFQNERRPNYMGLPAYYRRAEPPQVISPPSHSPMRGRSCPLRVSPHCFNQNRAHPPRHHFNAPSNLRQISPMRPFHPPFMRPAPSCPRR